MKSDRFFLCAVFLLAGLATLHAQDSAAAIAQARMKLESNDYPSAQAILTQAANAFPAAAAQVSSAYSDFGIVEYDRRNFLNAYSAFREALKLQSTNTTATQYYLRMRREMDVAKLRNEYVPPAAPSVSGPAETAGPTTAAQAKAEREEDLKILVDQLKVAETRMSAIESTATNKQAENDLLRQQLESQRQMVERMLSAPRTTTAARPTAEENAALQDTIRLLSEIAERDQSRPIVVQSDPALQGLVEQLAATREAIGKPNVLNIALVAIAAATAAALFGLIVFLLVAANRAKSRNPRSYEANLGVAALPTAPAGGGYVAVGMARTDTPLLEFIDSGPSNPDQRDLAVRRDLLKAERLNRMYEEVRGGSLGWNTVRQYIGELELSLRAEILSVVERKLAEGDLISNEAILPVLFPFLTDYDDFVREKAELLARTALGSRKASGGAESEEGDSRAEREDLDPLSLKNLMEIPRKLQTMFKNHDQTLMTAKLCRGMATVLGFSKEDRNLLYKAALAHDCGYLMMERDQLVRTVAKQEIDEEDFEIHSIPCDLGNRLFRGD